VELVAGYLNTILSPGHPYMICGVPVWENDEVELWYKNTITRDILHIRGYVYGMVDDQYLLLGNERGIMYEFHVARIRNICNLSKQKYVINGISFKHGDEIEFELIDRNIKGYMAGFDEYGWVMVIDHKDGGLRKCKPEYMRNVRRLE
jgi:hypothetical protein